MVRDGGYAETKTKIGRAITRNRIRVAVETRQVCIAHRSTVKFLVLTDVVWGVHGVPISVSGITSNRCHCWVANFIGFRSAALLVECSHTTVAVPAETLRRTMHNTCKPSLTNVREYDRKYGQSSYSADDDACYGSLGHPISALIARTSIWVVCY